jgi:hypothetical protein
VVRSCWDYVPRRAEFLAWAQRVPRLANPAEVLAWNTDKRYLRELAAAGVPVVPTTWVAPGRAWNGRPLLMELELTEPQLFLGHAPGAADRLAAAITARTRQPIPSPPGRFSLQSEARAVPPRPQQHRIEHGPVPARAAR